MKRILKNTLGKSSMFLMVALVVLGATSCSNDDGGDDTARMAVRMTDAPGDYDAVYVDVEDVRIKAETEGEEEESWVSIGNVNAGIYNLLELTGGVDVLLADAEVPAGPLSQIRLVLGDDNTIVVDGEEYPLSTPSAQQSGLKLQVNQTLEAGEEYYFLMDFDVEKSIVNQGNGGYSLKPTIRLITGTEGGKISGTVHPTNVQTLVTATNATTSISSYTNAEGEFVLHGVPDGTYLVTVTPDLSSGLNVGTVTDVQVQAGGNVTLETIFLD